MNSRKNYLLTAILCKLLNFTKDWSKKNNTEFFDYDWTARNIRTKEIVFADFGKPYDFFED